jgi:hypothetical protein
MNIMVLFQENNNTNPAYRWIPLINSIEVPPWDIEVEFWNDQEPLFLFFSLNIMILGNLDYQTYCNCGRNVLISEYT